TIVHRRLDVGGGQARNQRAVRGATGADAFRLDELEIVIDRGSVAGEALVEIAVDRDGRRVRLAGALVVLAIGELALRPFEAAVGRERVEIAIGAFEPGNARKLCADGTCVVALRLEPRPEPGLTHRRSP